MKNVLSRHSEPLLFKLPNSVPLPAVAVFLILAIILAPVGWYTSGEIVSPLSLAYAFALSNYLISCHEKELLRLKPLLTLDEQSFESSLHGLRNHPSFIFLAAWFGGPILVVIVNFNGPTITTLLSGNPISSSMIFNLAVVVFFWIFFIQLVIALFRNSLKFDEIGREHVTIDLIDPDRLTPFARVGIRNILLLSGAFMILPLAFINTSEYLQGVLTSILIVLPIGLILLILPMKSVRIRVKEAKQAELELVSRALRGDKDALKDSRVIKDEEDQNLSSLIMYRQMISEIREWPVNAPIITRLTLYVIVPLLAWVGAALVERVVDYVL